ncbi:hypothetical protein DOY81_001456 [Sarcophaga bullata]|nr:hypothetical protein DOY81_001456 [Sarcophaga bullata]
MIDLEDLPRLESLSPIRDVEDDLHRHAATPGMTIIPTTLCETLNNGNMNTMAVNSISRKTSDQLINGVGNCSNISSNSNSNSNGNIFTGNNSKRMLIGGGLRYISQIFECLINKFLQTFTKTSNSKN